MQTPAEDVRSWQKSGEYLLAVSISRFDPEPTSEISKDILIGTVPDVFQVPNLYS